MYYIKSMILRNKYLEDKKATISRKGKQRYMFCNKYMFH